MANVFEASQPVKARQAQAKTKARSVLLFCSSHLASKQGGHVQSSGEGTTKLGRAHVRGDGTGIWETCVPGQTAPSMGPA